MSAVKSCSGSFDMASLEAFDLLAWWKRNGPQFPVVSKIARRVLAIPASQATSERLFSMLGMTCFERRGSLDPIKANKQLVVRLSNSLAWISMPSNPAKPASEEAKRRREDSKKAARYWKALRLNRLLPQSTTHPPPSFMDFTESIELGPHSDKDEGTSLRLMDEIESDEYSSASSDDDTVSLDSFSEDLPCITTRRMPSTTNGRSSPTLPNVPPAKRPRTRSRTDTSNEPVMELAVVTESTDMIMAYFKNVLYEYEPNWDAILGTNKYFCNFRLVAKHGGTQSYSMELSNVGSRSFRNSRKSALAHLGFDFLLKI